MLEAYLEQVRRVAAAGAGTVVLPEAVLKVDASSLSTVDGPMQRLADETGARIVFGLAVIDPAAGTIDGRPGGYNTARVYAPNAPAQTYHKQHLIVTERYLPGSSLLLGSLNQQFTWAVAIFKDLDFPDLARANRSAGMDVMLVPAWDFDRDAWLHSRMAIMRGVENGAIIARAARSGALTISDPWGRVLVEERTGEAAFVTATADVPLRSTSTPASRLGPWFAWLCVALLIGAVGLLLRRRPTDASPATAAAEQPVAPADLAAAAG
jgi:apolipoprotein N-acyltransferase